MMRRYTNCGSIPYPQLAPGGETAVDYVAVKLIIGTALGKLHGLIGEALHFDVLQVLKSKPAKLLVRIEAEDDEKFVSSLMAFTFNLSKFGGNRDVSCYVRVNKVASHIGLVLDSDFV
jgi:hypothetical protein